MSEEEKQAIENLEEELILSINVDSITTEVRNEYVKIILNYIDKLQKDNYKLDRENQHFFDRIQDLQKRVKVSQNFAKIVERDYIDKDIIRNKIKELEKDLVQNYGTLGESLTTTEIKTLKELLGE